MKSRSQRVLVPENLFDQRVMMAIERGKLADLIFDDPGKLSHRALGRVLGALEKADGRPKPAELASDLPLFQAARVREPGLGEPSALERELAALNADILTPKEALEALYRLKALLAGEP